MNLPAAALAVGLQFAAFSAPASALSEPQRIEKNYVISPARGLREQTYDITVKDVGCKFGDLADADLRAPQGSKITVTVDKSNRTACSIPATLTIDKDAPLEVVEIRVVKEGTSQMIGYAPFEVTSVIPGPIPPGLVPQVDVLWSVLPKKIVRDNFGHEIANKFYCVEAVIGNNSGFDLQIAAVGFERPGLLAGSKTAKLPAASFPVARGTLERGAETGARNYILRISQALGPFAAGFIPFFRVPNRRANYSTGVAIFNLLLSGYELAVPDLTISQINRLENQMLHDNLIVSNNRQVRTMILIPRQLVKVSDDSPDDPLNVMKALGNLVLTGNTVEYLARVSVTATPALEKTPRVSKVLYPGGAQAFTLQGNTDQDVEITLLGDNLENAEVLIPEDVKGLAIKGEPIRTASELKATVHVSKDTPAGTYKLKAKNPYGTADFEFQVTR